MTPVFFNGYGEWLIKDCFGNSHPINEFGGYFMMPKEEVERCIRWQLHDVFCNYYDRLGPVHVAGDFKLTDDDERRYLDRKSILIDSGFSLGLNELEFVEKLLPIYPIQDIDCEFSKFARRNGISINDYYRCYFKIAKQDISDDPNQKKAKYILHEFELPTLSKELETTKIDLPERVSSPSSVIVNNKTAKRSNCSPIAEIVRAAVKQLLNMKNSSNDGSRLKPNEVAMFVLGDDFTHEDIASKTECKAIKDRKITLKSDGKTVGIKEIAASYSNTVSKEFQKSFE
jgi:hypothetical protein